MPNPNNVLKIAPLQTRDIFPELNFQDLYENSLEPQRIIDASGIILYCNNAYADFLGYSKDEIIGKSIFEHVPKEDLNALQETFKIWKDTGTVKNREICLKRKDGSIFPALLSATNIRDKEGNLIGSNTVIRDITDIYNARREIEQRETKIREQHSNLKKIDKLKDEFVAMISHELKTPLVPIKGYVDLLLSGQLGTLTDIQKQKLEIIMSSTNSLLRLISDLLDSQKIELGQLKLFKNKHNLNPIISKTIANINPYADRCGITITTDLQSEILCLCDDIRIEQVLTNILSNAMKFVSKDKGIISIQARNVDNNFAEIVIKDNGIGMQKDQLEKIFLKFYQIETYTTRTTQGTGLGLAICKGIIENHGGKIWADSEGFNLGTEFHILLPSYDVDAKGYHEFS